MTRTELRPRVELSPLTPAISGSGEGLVGPRDWTAKALGRNAQGEQGRPSRYR